VRERTLLGCALSNLARKKMKMTTRQESNEIFDRLAGEWSDEYQEGRQPLLRWIGKAGAELRKYERGHFPAGR